jgi:2-polyprenyl-3-methyl-5-hydroxy-6-metoxy-1,4-benzoquinol methylase
VIAANDLTPAVLDRFAADYYLNPAIADVDIEELAQQHSIPMIVDAVRGCERVLEMGFGTGLITRELLAAGVGMHLLEGSGRLCAEAAARHPGLVVHQSMFETFAPPEPYDAVLALHVLEHVDDPVALATHIGRWLRPNGVLVAVTPNAESLHRMLGVRMGLHERLDDLSARDHLVGHRRVYTLRELGDDLQRAGYECESSFGYLVKPLANSQLLALDPAVLEGLNRMSRDVPPGLCANIGIVARKR